MDKTWNNLPIEIPKKTNYNEATETNLEKEAAICTDAEIVQVRRIIHRIKNLTDSQFDQFISLLSTQLNQELFQFDLIRSCQVLQSIGQA